jgi:hypothetical protein
MLFLVSGLSNWRASLTLGPYWNGNLKTKDCKSCPIKPNGDHDPDCFLTENGVVPSATAFRSRLAP